MIKRLMQIFSGSSTDEAAASETKESTEKANADKAVVSSDGDMSDLENFVDYIVRALVDSPQAVSIKTEPGEDIDIIKIDCNKEDIGKIVGKKGKTIMAIRALVSGAAGRMQRKVTVEVVD